MKCPKCTNTNLGKKGPDTPCFCQTCKGIWLKEVGESNLPEEFLSNQAGYFDKENVLDSKTGLCPEGHGVMTRAKIPGDEPYYLEKCMKCGGIWFDKGELEKLVEDNLLDLLSEFWTASWRRQQLKAMDRQTYLRINEEKLGPEIFTQVLSLAKQIQQHPEKIRAISLLKYLVAR